MYVYKFTEPAAILLLEYTVSRARSERVNRRQCIVYVIVFVSRVTFVLPKIRQHLVTISYVCRVYQSIPT